MKKFRIIALLLLIAVMLSSCDVSIKIPGTSSLGGNNGGSASGGDNTGDGGSSGSNTPYVNDDITFDVGERVFIVIDPAANTPTCNVDLSITLAIGNPGALYMTDDQPIKDNELTLGRCNREVAKIGYQKLEQLPRPSILVARYGIYSMGNSVALVYDFVPGFEKETVLAAIKMLEDKFIECDKPIDIPAGRFYSATIDFSDEQAKRDEDIMDSAWAAFSKEAGDAATVALKEMYRDLYSDNLLTWFASLYDAELGGFYFSASARDYLKVYYNGAYYDLLPDIESTAQAIIFMEKSGMMSGFKDLKDVLPPEMQSQIIKFIKQKQTPGGYFYHPQWPEAKASISRRGRDLSNAVSVLRKLGAKPTYTTPTNVAGDGILWDGTPVSAVRLTLPLDTSSASAVSFVVATATAVPSHLVDKASFQTYLNGLSTKINRDSYGVGHELSSQTSEIKSRDAYLKSQGADYSLVDMLISFLDSKCSATTGHWGNAGTFSGLNGLMKISSVYRDLGAPLPYPEAAARSAIDTITKADIADSTVCYAYNSWVAVYNVIENVTKYREKSEADAIVSSIRGELRENAATLIKATADKQGSFICSDGSFSYYKTTNTETSQGMPVALPGIKEGDINATIICSTNTLEFMFKALGYPSVPIFSLSDLVTFLDLIDENQLKYNYSSSLSMVRDGYVNFSLYDYKDENGNTAKMIKLYDSEDYTTEKIRHKVITGIINSPEGVRAGLSIDDLDFYISMIWGSKFTYNYTSDTPDASSEYINYETKSPSGKAPVLKIYFSNKITNEADMREILTYLIMSERGAKAGLSLADIDYYVVEWKAHNYMFDNPSLPASLLGITTDEVKERAKHVDLNTDDPHASKYSLLANLVE